MIEVQSTLYRDVYMRGEEERVEVYRFVREIYCLQVCSARGSLGRDD